MALERRNPLPAGRYWATFSGDKIGLFEDWLKAFRPLAGLETEEPQPAAGGRPAFNFYIFKTTQPLVWLSQLGAPNIAPASIKTLADTATTPPAGGLFDGVTFPNLDGMGSILLLIGLAYALSGKKK